MMKNYIFKLFAGSIILVSSCTNSVDTNSNELVESPAFLKAYKHSTLPVYMKGCFGDSYSLPLIAEDSLADFSENGTVAYCTFKTNGNYYAAIRLGAADCMMPYLITYNKDGKVIDEKSISIGYCGSGPGFKCEEFASIEKDFSIYTSDSISETEIDTLGNEIESTLRKYIIYKKGKLLNSGKIELSDTLRKILIQ